MKVVVFVNKTSGNVIEVLPYREKYGKRVFETHVPLVMDLKIPCNDSDSHAFNCLKCVNNDWELCDRIKYLRAIWTAGTIDVPPKPTDHRYNVNLGAFLSVESYAKYHVDQTLEEIASILGSADRNQKTSAIIVDKAVK